MDSSFYREADSGSARKKFPAFYGTSDFLPYSQESITDANPQPNILFV
jgi:hypothetical protein